MNERSKELFIKMMERQNIQWNLIDSHKVEEEKDIKPIKEKRKNVKR